MITVYIKTNPVCPYCVRAKAWLLDHGFNYVTLDVSENADALAFLKGNGHRTVPQIYSGETLLVEGGFDGLSKLGEAGIERLRQAAGE